MVSAVSKQEEDDRSIELVSMAFREMIMFYFKGVNSFVTEGGIYLDRAPDTPTPRHNYERNRERMIDRCNIVLGGIPVVIVRKYPIRKLIFYGGTFTLNPLLEPIKAHIEAYMKRYLPSVKVETIPDGGAYHVESIQSVINGISLRSNTRPGITLPSLDELYRNTLSPSMGFTQSSNWHITGDFGLDSEDI